MRQWQQIFITNLLAASCFSLTASAQSLGPGFLRRPLQFVQQTSISDANLPVTLAYPSANAGGNLLIAIVSDDGSVAPGSLTDSNNNTWVALPPEPDSLGDNLQIWFAANSVAGPNTITYNGANEPTMILAEYSGVAKSNPLDAIGGQAGFTTSNIYPGNLTASVQDLVVTALQNFGGASLTYTGPTTTRLRAADLENFLYLFDDAAFGLAAGAFLNPTSTLGVSTATWAGEQGAFRSLGTLAPIAPTKFAVTTSPISTTTWGCSPLTIQAQDAGGIARMMQTNSQVTLSTTNTSYFSDSSCLLPLANPVIFWAGQTSQTIYVAGTAMGSVTISGTPTNGFGGFSQTETFTLSTYTWIGGTSTAWATASNWSGGMVPTSASDVHFDSNCTTNCSPTLPSSAVTVNSLTLHASYPSSATVTLGGTGASLTITDLLRLSGGNLTATSTSALTIGSLYSDGTSLFTQNHNMTVTGSSFKFHGSFSTTVVPTTTFTGAAVFVDANGGFSQGVYNNPSGVLTATTLAGIGFTLAAGTVNVVGDSEYSAILSLASKLTISAGTMNLSNVLALVGLTGTTVASGATLNITGSSDASVVSLSKITNAGTLTCNTTGGAGVFTLNTSPLTNTGTLNLSGCATSISSNLTINGSVTFGTTTVQPYGSSSTTLTVAAGNTLTFMGTLTMAGTSSYHVLLRSGIAGTPFNIATTSAQILGPYLDVKDSTNSGGYVLHAGPNSINSGGNTNWSFP